MPTTGPKRISYARFCKASSCAYLDAIPAAPQAGPVDDCSVQSKGATGGQNAVSPSRSFGTLLPALCQRGSKGSFVAKERRKKDLPPGTGAAAYPVSARIAADRMDHVDRLHAMSRKCLAKTATISLKNDVQTDAYG